MEQNNKLALSMFATVQEYKDAVKAFDANLKRRAEDAERVPAEKLEWEAPVVQRQTFAEIMPKREAFIKHCEARGLDTSIEKDAWGAHIFAHSHIQAMWEGWFSATAPATPAPVVVEDVTAAGTQWGVSFAGANPEAKDYVACASRAEAERLIAAPAVEAPSQFGSPELQAIILANLAAPAVECGNCFEGKSDMDHVCRKCKGSGRAPAVDAAELMIALSDIKDQATIDIRTNKLKVGDMALAGGYFRKVLSVKHNAVTVEYELHGERESREHSWRVEQTILAPTAPAPVDAAELGKLATYDPDRENAGCMELRDKYNDGDYVKAADSLALVAQQAARIEELEVQATKSREFTRVCGNVIHNMTVGNQAAWIEWRHGGGAEEAMEWIENGLIGPGMIPGEGEDDENDPNLTNAQAYFDAHVSYGDDAVTQEGK